MPRPLTALVVLLVALALGPRSGAAQERPALVPQSGHASALGGMNFSADGTLLLSWEKTGNTAIVWDVTTAKQLRTFALPFAPVGGAMRRNIEGEPMALFIFGDALRTYLVRTGEPGDSTLFPAGGLVHEWALGGPAGRQVFARAYQYFQTDEVFLAGVVGVEGPDARFALQGTGYRGGPYGPYMAVSPDGTLLAVSGSGVEDGIEDDAGHDGLNAIGFWDAATGELRGQIPVPGTPWRPLASTPRARSWWWGVTIRASSCIRCPTDGCSSAWSRGSPCWCP